MIASSLLWPQKEPPKRSSSRRFHCRAVSCFLKEEWGWKLAWPVSICETQPHVCSRLVNLAVGIYRVILFLQRVKFVEQVSFCGFWLVVWQLTSAFMRCGKFVLRCPKHVAERKIKFLPFSTKWLYVRRKAYEFIYLSENDARGKHHQRSKYHVGTERLWRATLEGSGMTILQRSSKRCSAGNMVIAPKGQRGLLESSFTNLGESMNCDLWNQPWCEPAAWTGREEKSGILRLWGQWKVRTSSKIYDSRFGGWWFHWLFFPTPFGKDMERLSKFTNIFGKALSNQLFFLFFKALNLRGPWLAPSFGLAIKRW